MTEDEYVAVSNLVRTRMVRHILQEITPDEIFSEEALGRITDRLWKMENKAAEKVGKLK